MDLPACFTGPASPTGKSDPPDIRYVSINSRLASSILAERASKSKLNASLAICHGVALSTLWLAQRQVAVAQLQKEKEWNPFKT